VRDEREFLNLTVEEFLVITTNTLHAMKMNQLKNCIRFSTEVFFLLTWN